MFRFSSLSIQKGRRETCHWNLMLHAKLSRHIANTNNMDYFSVESVLLLIYQLDNVAWKQLHVQNKFLVEITSQFISLSVLPLNPRGKNDLPPSMFIIAKCPADSSISLQWSNYPCGSLSNHSRQCFMSSHSGTWGRDIIGLLFPLIISSPPLLSLCLFKNHSNVKTTA